MSTSNRRQGFALAVALAAIVIIGALIAGVFFASTQEYRIGRNTILQTRALAASEYGANRTLTDSGWKSAWSSSAKVGVIDSVQYKLADGSLDSVRVTNLGNGNFFITSEARAGAFIGAQARARVGRVAALAVPHLNVLAALTTRGATKIGGSSLINGNDSPPDGWDCPPAGGALPGLTTNDVSQITFSGCKDESCIQGDPQIEQSAAAGDDSTYSNFGDMDWTQFTSMANKTYTAGSTLNGMQFSYSGTTCNTGDPNNWGDPLHTDAFKYCADYFPIIYVPGNLHVTGGYGQGILLVDGDLSVAGGFQFFGPVIVHGSLSTSGTGGHFNGGVMAANVDFEQNTVIGNAVVNYSQCALSRAINGSGRPSLANGRSWIDLP